MRKQKSVKVGVFRRDKSNFSSHFLITYVINIWEFKESFLKVNDVFFRYVHMYL